MSTYFKNNDRSKVQDQDEITEIGEEQVKKVDEKQHEELIIQLKVENVIQNHI